MTYMKLKYLAAFVFLASFITFWFIESNFDKPVTCLSSHSPHIQEAITIILKNQSSRRGEKLDILSQAVSSKNRNIDTKNQNCSFYTHFIQGYIASANNNFDLAENHFNDSQQHLSPLIPTHIQSRFYYELSYVQLKQGDAQISERNYGKAEALFNKKEQHHNTFITISLGRTYDLAYVDEGSELSIKQAQKTLEFAESIRYSKMEDVYFILGLSYWNNNQTIMGINFKLKALNSYIQKQQHGDITYTLTDIGIDYLFLRNYDEAIRQLTHALQYQAENYKIPPKEAYYITYKLHTAYLQLNDLGNAKYYLDKAQFFLDTLADSIDKENFKSNQLLLEADYLTTIDKADEALLFIHRASERHQQGLANSFYHFDISLHETYGKIYNRLGLYEQSVQQHKLAEGLINKRKLFYLQNRNYIYLYETYMKQMSYEKAISYLEKSHFLHEDQLNSNNQAQTQFLVYSFDNTKKESRILELEKNTNYIIIFTGLLICILIAFATFMRILMGKNKEISTLNIQLHQLSITDGLTAIPNRRALEDHLSKPYDQLNTRSIMMIDIDYFKQYNDTYGHKHGDDVLIAIAKALKSCCRNNDFLARFGGEEFILVMDHADKAKSISTAEHIKKSIEYLEIPHQKSAVSPFVTLSIGITTFDVNTPYKDNETAIIEADNALYYSKSNGRNQYNHLCDIVF
ncbi:GGDEF domain-containing protein [Aliivibrio sifiae]|uniref:diguanylate cyclase n=2 Tax=Aliivibrio sifiae TaxID=566293 RepID=A0ABQ6AE77_9GAMM|nr:GGDEF domain-containing protein [Aliivibrio sifiae]